MTYDLIANEALAELASVLGIANQEGDWQERALCAQVDPEIFFPEKGASTAEAKSVCQRCEVREDCLQDALDHDDRFGIFGGKSERERRKLRPGFIPDRGQRDAEILHRLEEGVPAHQIATDLYTNMATVAQIRAQNLTDPGLKEAS